MKKMREEREKSQRENKKKKKSKKKRTKGFLSDRWDVSYRRIEKRCHLLRNLRNNRNTTTAQQRNSCELRAASC
jgi:hypothetical protein